LRKWWLKNFSIGLSKNQEGIFFLAMDSPREGKLKVGNKAGLVDDCLAWDWKIHASAATAL
jgi:hypothetical protein